MTRSKQPLAALLAALLFAVTSSCSNNDNDDDADPTPTPTPSPESEVEAAYLAYWEMGARLLEAPDPADPEIPQRTSGEALTNLVDGLTTLKQMSLRYRLGPQYSHSVRTVVVEGGSATAEVCVVDDAALVDASSGEVQQSGTTTALWTVSLLRSSGDWRVDELDEGNVEEGAGQCDE